MSDFYQELTGYNFINEIFRQMKRQGMLVFIYRYQHKRGVDYVSNKL